MIRRARKGWKKMTTQTNQVQMEESEPFAMLHEYKAVLTTEVLDQYHHMRMLSSNLFILLENTTWKLSTRCKSL